MDLALTDKIHALQEVLAQLPQYEPLTEHIFHGGMYCRKVWRAAGVLVVGKVHKKEHFYVILSGTVAVTTDDGVQEITGPVVLQCKPGTKRAVYALTDALCATFHRTDALTIENAEAELVEQDENATFAIGNKLKQGVLQ